MNAAKEAALLMSSLSIYRGITLRTVAKAYYELLCSVNKPVFEFAQAWGNFVSLLCERNCIDNFSGYLTETALYDENIFSRAAAAGREKELSSRTINAIRRDLSVIQKISMISPDRILNDYLYRDELGTVANNLPRWNCGQPIREFLHEDEIIDDLAEHGIDPRDIPGGHRCKQQDQRRGKNRNEHAVQHTLPERIVAEGHTFDKVGETG